MRDTQGRFTKGSKIRLGTKHSEKSIMKISTANKGRITSEEAKRKIGIAIKGEKNGSWKGDAVSYNGLHRWIRRQLGRASKCMINSEHKSTRYHWGNISKEYKRDFSDWIQMCPSCNLRDRIGRRVSP